MLQALFSWKNYKHYLLSRNYKQTREVRKYYKNKFRERTKQKDEAQEETMSEACSYAPFPSSNLRCAQKN